MLPWTSARRALTLTLAAFLVAALAAPLAVEAQTNQTGDDNQAGGRTIRIIADDDAAAGPYYFTIDNSTERNPTIQVQAGETVTFRVVNQGSVQHNFHILGNINKNTTLLNPGQEENLTVTFPQGFTSAPYQCDPHAFQMKGTISTQAAGGNGAQERGGDTPGFEFVALVGALVIVGALLRKR